MACRGKSCQQVGLRSLVLRDLHELCLDEFFFLFKLLDLRTDLQVHFVIVRKESVNINFCIEIKGVVKFFQHLLLRVVLYSLQLEKELVWRVAEQVVFVCNHGVALLVLVAIDLVDAVSIDCLVDILVLDVQEYDVGLLDFAV